MCPPVRKIIHSLKLVDYLHIQADKSRYNYVFGTSNEIMVCIIKILKVTLLYANATTLCDYMFNICA